MAGICGLKISAVALSHTREVAPPSLLRFLTRSNATSAFAAVHPQLDNDCYYYYNQQDESEAISRRDGLNWAPVADPEGFFRLRGIQWAFIGNPNAKKHIANSVNQGKLVPEDIIFGLLSKRLEDGYYKGETGFILDGIPRTKVQAEILDKLVDIDLVVNFKCVEDCMLEHQRDNSVFSHSHQSDRFRDSAWASLHMASQDGVNGQSKYSFYDRESSLKGNAHIYAKQVFQKSRVLAFYAKVSNYFSLSLAVL
ncbi:adenylate kinase [Sarracenia purpurea var. burkii]